MEAALAAFSSGQVRQPVRTLVEPGAGAFFWTMPAYLEAGPAMGAKLVTLFPDNAQRRLPTHQALIVLLDGQTGFLEAVIDGGYITEARTAAVSAVAVRALAKLDTKVLAIIGSGAQARSHLEALPLVRAFSQRRCWSPTEAHLHKIAAECPEVTAAASAEAAVRGAD